jgi:hypothetical protein
MSYRKTYLWPVCVVLLVTLSAVAAAACGGSDAGGTGASAQATAPAAASGTSSPAASTAASATPMAEADAQAVRDLMTAYWTAYNAYDAEKALSYLEEGYRASQDKTVRSEIGQIKTFGVKLGVKEKSAPVLTGTDQSEMHIDMKTPTGGRELIMKFTRVGGTWMITDVEEI